MTRIAQIQLTGFRRGCTVSVVSHEALHGMTEATFSKGFLVVTEYLEPEEARSIGEALIAAAGLGIRMQRGVSHGE